jgi:hypothetical protein
MGRKATQELNSPTMSPADLLKIRRVVQIGQLALENDQAALRPVLQQTLQAIQMMSQSVGLAPSRIAQQVENVRVVDPLTNEPVSLDELNPLEDPHAEDN